MEDFAGRLEKAKKTLVNTDFPTQVVVESTSICNFDCPGCPSPTLERSRGFIKFDLFKKIVDEIVRASDWPERDPIMSRRLYASVSITKKHNVHKENS